MFDWDEANEGHIWERHGVSAAEAEEALLDPDRSAYSSRVDGVEERFLLIGATLAGRVLSVVYVWRDSRISRGQRPRAIRPGIAALPGEKEG